MKELSPGMWVDIFEAEQRYRVSDLYPQLFLHLPEQSLLVRLTNLDMPTWTHEKSSVYLPLSATLIHQQLVFLQEDGDYGSNLAIIQPLPRLIESCVYGLRYCFCRVFRMVYRTPSLLRCDGQRRSSARQ